jgi:hypothetical protein
MQMLQRLKIERERQVRLLLSMTQRLLLVAFSVLQRQHGAAYCHQMFTECNRRTNNAWSFDPRLLRMLMRMRMRMRTEPNP